LPKGELFFRLRPSPEERTMENLPPLLKAVIATVVFSGIGIVTFLVAFYLIEKLSPFSIRKEIETDQNTSLAILIGSVIIGLAIIISAAVHG
jgi:uncharacterized membrane protein YjfL (UPF0719 family)